MNKNVFTARVCFHLAPLYLQDKKLTKEFQKENMWVYDYIESWPVNNRYIVRSGKITSIVKKVLEKITSPQWLEQVLKKYQLQRIIRNPKTKNPNGRLEYNDHRLEFHPDSAEISVINKYKKSIDLIY